MDKTQIHPTPAIRAAANALENSIGRYLAAQDTVPSYGTWEALDEAYLMIGLGIRNVEGVITLARQDLVLLPGAMVMARVAFETGVTVRWLLDPDDPFDREMRWLRTLKTHERFYREFADILSSRKQDVSAQVNVAAVLGTFHDQLVERLPPKYRGSYQPKELPNFRQMLESLGEKDQYLHYKIASQYAHGTQEATALYRRHLGTMKEFGEFVTPAYWAHCLLLCFHSLFRPGRRFLERAGGDPNAFAPPDFERDVFQTVMTASEADA